jgi:hypothetical protein
MAERGEAYLFTVDAQFGGGDVDPVDRGSRNEPDDA